MNKRHLITTFASAASGAICGAILGAVSGSLYLVLIYPIVAGLAAGAATSKAIKYFNVPGARFAAACGAVAGVTALICLLFVAFQIQIAAEVAALSQRGYSDVQLQVEMGEWAGRVSGTHSIDAFVAVRLKSGARLMEGAYLNMGVTGNAILLLLELIAALGASVILARNQGRQPFCRHCGHWYARRVVGSAPAGGQSTVMAALKNRQFYRAGRRLSPDNDQHPVKLHGRFCDTCDNGEVILELEVGEAGGRPHLIYTETTRHADLEAILDSRSPGATEE